MRSTFYCLACKTGTNNINETKAKELHGIPHRLSEIAEKGYWAVGLYCKGCDTPLYVRRPHLIEEQRLAFRRHNKKKEKSDGKNASKGNDTTAL